MKLETQNEYHKAVNKAVDYINAHLGEPIDLERVAEAAHVSEFHFHRIFKAYIGEPVGAYITRLRLEHTAQKLQTSQLTLADIAAHTGYQSQHSLSKAFKRHFGVSPSAFKNIQTYFSSQVADTPVAPLEAEPELREVSSMHLLYIRIIAGYGSEPDYDKAWSKLLKHAQQKGLLRSNTEFIGLSFDDPNITKEEQCRFYACITSNHPVKAEGAFGSLALDGGLFAVFTLRGPYSGLNELYRSIYFDWLPRSGRHLRHSMPFEKYLNNPDKVNEKDILTEIYIPIK